MFNFSLPIDEFKFKVSLLLALLYFIKGAIATPTLALPINSQVPPVARVGKSYQFVFAKPTFSDNSSSLQYALENSPSWLTLDGANRALSGTPKDGDTGPVNFKLTASDSSGSASDSVTLIVSNSSGPGLGMSISEQLGSFGSTSTPNTLLLYPASPLSLHFGFDTFTNTDSTTNYYALCANNTPLPSWMSFDPTKLAFSGTTPQFTSADELPQVFDVSLTASDVAGFSAAVATFRVVIELHQLTFGSKPLIIDVTPGEPIKYTGLQTALTSDGMPIEPDKLKHVDYQGPAWLTLDPSSLEISGTVPQNFQPQTASVSALDLYDGIANTTVTISTGSTSDLIAGSIPPLNARIGEHFSYTFSHTLFPTANIVIGMNLGNTSSWLHFDSDTLTLSGTVPSDLAAQTDSLYLTVTQGSKTMTKTVNLTLIARNGFFVIPSISSSPSSTVQLSPSSTGSIQSTAVTANPTSPIVSNNPTGNINSDKQKVVAAVVLSVVGLTALLLCGIWLLKKRRKTCNDGREKKSLLTRFRRPEMIIGEPEEFSRGARPASRDWSLPSFEFPGASLAMLFDRNRHSHVAPPDRPAKPGGWYVGPPSERRRLGSNPPFASRPMPQTPTREPRHKPSFGPSSKGSKEPVRFQRIAGGPIRVKRGFNVPADGRPPIYGLGHGRELMLPPPAMRDYLENQRKSRYQSRVGSGIGKGFGTPLSGHNWVDPRGIPPPRYVPQPSDEAVNDDPDWSSTTTHSANSVFARYKQSRSYAKGEQGASKSTVRLVSSSPSSSGTASSPYDTMSPLTIRDRYIRDRRQCNKDGTTLSSTSLKRMSSWTYDLSSEDRRSGLGFSAAPRGSVSAQRKGQMMQKGIGATEPQTYHVLNRFQSVNSLADGARLEDPEEHDSFNSDNGEIREAEEANGEKVWKKADDCNDDLRGEGAGRLSMQRLSWLTRCRHEQPQGNGELTLGTAGRKPVSVENEMDIARGLPGSKSVKATLGQAFP